MIYDFDKPVDRTGSGDLKHEALKTNWGRDDLLPLWVADMDWETPNFITDALKKRLEHSLFGYTVEPDEYWSTVIQWIKEHHGWEPKQEWMTYIPGIVKGIGMAVNVFCKEDEKVIIQPPVYHPFRLTPEGNGRKVVMNPLRKLENGYYEMDFDNLAEVADDKCRLLILCNPHNPAGICWDAETLRQLAHFCTERNIIVISDEIHCDMALWEHKHIPFATVNKEAEQNSITFSAPSKTFNIAGIVSSWSVIPNPKIRIRYYSWLEANEFNYPTLFAPIATMAAFQNGEEWRQQMLHYVERNIDFTVDFCKKYIPQIKPLRPQASYLVWLDCNNLGLTHEQLLDLFVDKAHLALNDGEMFGPGGEGFMRLNVGTQRAVLQQAMEQLKVAVDNLKNK